ncbi:predicted protein [Chaetoceros tenuissimus]|uniref:Uncharacterized protein n=1 Tax=Chaetoceros tenuissimus TaxID=426638 RepID=A0AAD3GZ95_9STRA|nr:predicted protein [Chaetoceros tenuissimus]
MSSQETRSARKARKEREESEGLLYPDKPDQVVQESSYKTILKDVWNIVKNVEGMQKSEWTQWTAKKLLENPTQFRRITGKTMGNDDKIKHLLNSIQENTNVKVDLEESGTTRIVRIWFPIPQVQGQTAATLQGHEEEQDEEENEREQSESEGPPLAQNSIEIDENNESSEEDGESGSDTDREDINASILQIEKDMDEKLENTRDAIDNYNNNEPDSQDARERTDFMQTLNAVSAHMNQLLETTKKLDEKYRTRADKILEELIKKEKVKMKEHMKTLEAKMEKDLKAKLEKDLETKLMNTLQANLQANLQSMEAQTNKRIKDLMEERGEQELERQKDDLDSFKEDLLLQMENERIKTDKQWKEQFEKEKNQAKFPLPYHPPGAPTISTPFNTNVPVSQAIKHTNTPRSPGRQAKLTDYDKPDTYVYEGSKFTVRPQLLIDSVNNIPTLKDKDDIIYVYTAIHTVARTSGVLLTTPATIQIYTMHHPYPTTFGIRCDAESNPNIDFQASVSLNQLYKLMDRALYNLLTEVISEDYYEAKQIMDNAARDGEGYKALYMLLKLCLPRLNPMVAPTVPPLWTQGTELTKFVAKVRSYKDFDSNFDDETAIRHILQHVPEDEYPGVATVRGKYQAYVDAKETYDIQYSNIPNPPLPPPLPGDVSLAYIAYNINKNPVNATTRRMIAEEINKHPINAITRRAITEEIQKVQATIEVEEPTVMLTRRTGTKELCQACGTYGHQANIDGCDQLAIVQNCLKFRQLCKKNNEESTIKNIQEKYKNFNEDKKKRSQEMSTRRNTERGNRKNDRNTERQSRSKDERRSRSRDRTRITRVTSAHEDSDSLYTDLSDDEYSFDTSESYDRY